MKKLTSIASAALFAATVCASGNLIKNGDFSGETLAPWASPQRMKKSVHSLVDGKLVVTGDTQNKNNLAMNCIQNLPTLEIGKSYLLTGTAISKAVPVRGKFCRVNIRAINAQGTSIGYYGFSIDLSNTAATEYSFVYTPKAGSVRHQLYITNGRMTDSDQVIIDDLSLTELKKVEDDPANLLKNGNFEDPSLVPWKTPQTGSDRHFFGIFRDAASGNFCLKLSGDAANKNNSFLTCLQPINNIKPGQKYTLSAKYLCQVGVTGKKVVRIQIREVKPNGQTLRYCGGALNLHKKSFADYTYTFTPDKNAASWVLYISTTGLDRDDMVLIDDVKLVPAN